MHPVSSHIIQPIRITLKYCKLSHLVFLIYWWLMLVYFFSTTSKRISYRITICRLWEFYIWQIACSTALPLFYSRESKSSWFWCFWASFLTISNNISNKMEESHKVGQYKKILKVQYWESLISWKETEIIY